MKQHDNFTAPSLRRLLVQLGAVLAVVAALLVAVFVVVDHWVGKGGEFGTCVRLGPCQDVPLQTIEWYSGTQFPDGSEVLASTASPDAQGGFGVSYVRAVISLPTGAKAPSLTASDNDEVDEAGRRALQDRGAAHIRAQRNDAVTLVTGTRDGMTLVYVYSTWKS
jgi:hypothetical protein